MKATDLLKRQHDRIQSLFERVKGGGDASSVLVELANEMSAHMAIEQNLFYPAVRDVDPGLVDGSYEEHAIAEIALKRVLKTEPDQPTFEAKLEILEDLFEEHADEEEEQLFPAVESAMADDVLEQLGEQLETAFAGALSEGFSALVPQSLARTSADQAREEMATPRDRSSRPNGVRPVTRREGP